MAADPAAPAATLEQDNGWTLELRPRDPIIVRDARPFAPEPGARAVTLDWPLPATIAGALRTHAGNTLAVDWDHGGPDAVRDIAVRGPFLLRRDPDGSPRVFFPAPRDAVPWRTDAGDQSLLRLRPLAAGAVPPSAASDLWPGLRPVRVEREVKPAPGATFWSANDSAAWLANARSTTPALHTSDPLPTDVRTHVAIDPATLTQIEGALFSTEALAFDPRLAGATGAPTEAMLCRLTGAPPAWRPAPAFVRIGGENRQVEVVPVNANDPWPLPPNDLVASLAGSRHLRLQLVTPALFARSWQDRDSVRPPPAWLPAWLDQHTLSGKPPHWQGPGWTLVSAVVGRRLPLSGWDMTYRDPQTGFRGRPKRTRYAVPAGSVYFFELPGPLTPEQARALWLFPVSDRAYDRRNGFGLVLPGIWEAWDKEAS